MKGRGRGKERAELRAEAHHLDPLVHVGHQGVTPTVVQALAEVLRTRELVKVQVSRNLETGPREIAGAMADATGSEVIQVIGRKVTLYRENPDIQGKQGDLPPWRR